MTREGGKPLIENTDEVGWTASAFHFYAELARAEQGRVIPPVEASQLALVLKEPLGVVGCIVPWNYPLLLLAWKLAPALAAGNALRLQAVGADAAVDARARARASTTCRRAWSTSSPAPGDVGEALVDDARVDRHRLHRLASRRARRIAERAAARIARVNLEMGGKDAFIVCADVADEIEIAARGGAWAAFLNAGQVCTSAERFYVERSVYEPFVEAFVEHTRTLRVGDPMDPATDIGPMASAVAARQGARAGRGRGRRPAPRCSSAARRAATSAGTS